MIRRTLALAALALAPAATAPPLAAAAKSPAHRSDGKLSDWRGTPTNLGGRTQLSKGELIYSDYLYDDYGADANGIADRTTFRANLAPTSGDYRYPSDPRYGLNAADLREFRLASTTKNLFALIRLQTLKSASTTSVLIALDTDGRESTGAAAWPGGVGVTRTRGADRFILVSPQGATVYDARRGIMKGRRAISTRDNAIEVTVPRKRKLRVSRRARVWVLTGLAAADGSFVPKAAGASSAYDLGFQGAETYGATSHWGDQRQAAGLASGDLTAFGRPFDITELVRRRSRAFRPGPGFYNVIFRSKHSYGEGIDPKTDDSDTTTRIAGSAPPMFLGRHQPYGLYLPPGWKAGARTPLTLDGHSLDVNHNQYRATGRQLPAYGDQRGAMVITPLARGIDTWYLEAGLEDVLEATAHVRRRFRADRERTSITGYSMGGYMTYRLGLLRPDAFTSAVVHVGPPGYYSWPYPAPLQSTDRWRVPGFTNRIVENGLNLPFEINHGNADQLVPVTGVSRQAETFRRAGNPYRYYLHAGDDHFSFLLAGNFAHSRDWLGRVPPRRNLRPTRVRFVRYPSMDLPRYGLKWNAAYWARDIVVRDAKAVDASGAIDATTWARGGHRPRAQAEPLRVEPPGAGVSPGTVTGQRLVDGAPIARRNGFEATLRNVSSVRLKSRWMGLSPRAPLSASLSGDGRTTLRLEGRWAPRARLDGAPVRVTRTRRGTVVTVDLTPGRAHTLTLG